MTDLRGLYLDADALAGLVSRLQEYGYGVTLDQVLEVGRSGAPATHAVNRAARGDADVEEAAWEIVDEIVGGPTVGKAA